MFFKDPSRREVEEKSSRTPLGDRGLRRERREKRKG